MIKGVETVVDEVLLQLRGDQFWRSKLEDIGFSRIHLGIFSEPYLTFILEGKKTIESRFSKNKIAPFNQVEKGDILLLKPSGKGINGICVVDKAWFYLIESDTLDLIREKFGKAICPAEKSFWSERKAAAYCSLIWISQVRSFDSIPIEKRDRRGWVILK